MTGQELYKLLNSGELRDPRQWQHLPADMQRWYEEGARAFQPIIKLLEDYRDTLTSAYETLRSHATDIIEQLLEERGEALGLWMRCDECGMLSCICDEEGN